MTIKTLKENIKKLADSNALFYDAIVERIRGFEQVRDSYGKQAEDLYHHGMSNLSAEVTQTSNKYHHDVIKAKQILNRVNFEGATVESAERAITSIHEFFTYLQTKFHLGNSMDIDRYSITDLCELAKASIEQATAPKETAEPHPNDELG